MKKIIGFITIVMVLIGLIACDTDQSGSVGNNTPTNKRNRNSSSVSDSSSSDSSSSSSALDSSSSNDSSSSSSQSGDIVSSSVSGSSSSDSISSSSSQSEDSSSLSVLDSSSSGDISSSSIQSGDIVSSSVSDSSSSDSSSSSPWILGNGIITMVIPTYQDIDNLLTYSDNTFTALLDYLTYSWYIDSTKQSNSDSTFMPDTSLLSAGTHSVTVMVTDDHGGAYSAEMTFQVKKSY